MVRNNVSFHPNKKRRRLKKKVRRGCYTILFFLFVLVGFTVYKCQRRIHLSEMAASADSIGPDQTDTLVMERLHSVLHRPEFTDTNKLSISVYDLTRQCSVLKYHVDRLMIPASCMKLLTAITAYHRLGIDHIYQNSLYARGTIKNGTLCGDLILCLDDDPHLESFQDFVDALSRKGIRHIEGGIIFDMVRTDTLRQHATASPWDIPYSQVPLLMKGEKRVRQEFMYLLSLSEITYHNNPLFSDSWLVGLDPTKSPQEYRLALKSACRGAKLLYQQTHTLREVIAPMLIFSSNVKAESVFYHTNHVYDRWGGGSREDNYSVMTFIREEMCQDPDAMGYIINDGSGLSPENRLTADFLVQLLEYAYRKEEIFDVLIHESLATPEEGPRSGSLTGRMMEPVFRDRIFAKTGTLTTLGVSSLSGYARGDNGRWFAFSIINEGSPVYDSRLFQDRICKALVSPVR